VYKGGVVRGADVRKWCRLFKDGATKCMKENVVRTRLWSRIV
jgi:hypothetical protein